ncbi:hypothetical protein [Thiolapillus sp.]|uniref:hypothetical protein n=1 Tax=Thiolapillus sp. TaxID=2017437 RepID=UPI003AF97286
MGDMRAFYVALMAVYGPSHQIQAPLRSSDGSALLTDKEAILQRWSEHFEGLFSDRSWSWMIHPLVKRSRKPQCS